MCQDLVGRSSPFQSYSLSIWACVPGCRSVWSLLDHRGIFKNTEATWGPKSQANAQAVGVNAGSWRAKLHPYHHLMERSIYLIVAVITLNTFSGLSSSLLQDPKILVMSRYIPARLFLQWQFLLVSLPMTYLDNIVLNKTLLTLLEECLVQLLKLAVFWSDAQMNNNTSQDLNIDLQRLLVREEIVSALLHSPDLQTPAEFLQMYSSPFHISSESDQVWPMAQHTHL
eukprot:XP_017952926.1 PREDICTED: uncharacterized protein C7orf62-like isoform X1 [Xenopus tropicalis]